MKLLVVIALGVIIGGTGAWWGFPPVAAAAGQCNDYKVNDAGRTNAGGFADLGIRASGGDHVYSGGVQCAHVDSVIVFMPNESSYAEAGWTTMQTAYASNFPQANCNTSGMTNSPAAIWVYLQGTQYTCNISTTISVSGGDDPTVAVYSDQANPGTWILDFSNGSGNGFTHSVSGWFYTKGAGLTNCDRHYVDPSDDSIESCQAHFMGMQFRTSAWVDWGSEVCADGVDGTPPLPNLDTDGHYHNQLTQPNEVVVSANAARC